MKEIKPTEIITILKTSKDDRERDSKIGRLVVEMTPREFRELISEMLKK